MNGFEGLSISEFHLLSKGGDFNSNSRGVIVLPNPSVVSIDAGNLTATLSVADTVIGNITLPDLSLQPGNLSYPFWSTTNQTQVAALLQEPVYSCGVLPVDVRPDASTFDGQVIPYLTRTLQSATLQILLDIAPTLDEAGFGFLIRGNCSSK